MAGAMRVTGFVSISFLLAALVTSPAAAQPGAEEPATAGESAAGEPPAGEPPAAPMAPAPAPAAGRAAAAVLQPAPLSYGSPSSHEPRPVVATGRQLSEGTALALSLGGTTVAWALMVSAAKDDSEGLAKVALLASFLAPSAGHWYRGALLTRGMGVRALGVASFALGLAGIDCEGDCDAVEAFLYGGLALYAIGTIDDVVTAPLRVRQHNQRLQQLQLAPMVAPGAMGLALGGRF
jgi:hypothetical protein